MSINDLYNSPTNEDASAGFTVPDGYFDALKSKIKLQTIERSPVYDHPWPDDTYFKEAKNRILLKTTQKATVMKLWYAPQQWVKYAAALVLAAGLYWTVVPVKMNSDLQSMNSAEPSNEEIVNYLDVNGMNDLNVAEIVPVSQTATDIPGSVDETLIIESL